VLTYSVAQMAVHVDMEIKRNFQEVVEVVKEV
jgi:hypothetical protein